MEVLSEVLPKLVCENCDGYLSRGPVHLMDNVRYRCGRCLPSEEEQSTRIEAYEELAKLMTFPCKYQENGCPNKVPFAENEAHEETCPYRKYICPIAESDQCKWTGIQTELLKHWRRDHHGYVVKNPCTFTYNITRSSLHNYLLYAFGVLFLIQTKVCTVTQKIKYSVRLLGDSGFDFNYKYTLCVQIVYNLEDAYEQERVTNCTCVTFDNDFSIYINIDELLGMQVKFTDVIFTLTVKSVGNLTQESLAACRTYFLKRYILKKVRPHYFNKCQVRQASVKTEECIACQCRRESLYRSKLSDRFDHIERWHDHPVIQLQCSFIDCDCDLDRAYCWYTTGSGYYMKLTVQTNLRSNIFSKYECTVEFSDSDTGRTLTDVQTVLRTSGSLLAYYRAWYVDCNLRRHWKDLHLTVKIIIRNIKKSSNDVNI